MKDLLNSVTVTEYVKEIISVPLQDTVCKYNRSGSEKKRACPVFRELSRYRYYISRRRRLKKAIDKETEFLAETSRRSSEIAEELRYRKSGLTDLYIEQSITELKIRKLEGIPPLIESPIVKRVVEYRYFEAPSAPLPSWSKTAKDLGIPLNGAELRAYVSSALDKLISSL